MITAHKKAGTLAGDVFSKTNYLSFYFHIRQIYCTIFSMDKQCRLNKSCKYISAAGKMAPCPMEAWK